jgi:hypothetical protein
MRHKDFNQMIIQHAPYPVSGSVISSVVKSLFWQYLQFQIQVLKKPYRYLFLLCPARSGSSLTLHILNSNPDISGYGENHVSYDSERDLHYLALRTCWDLKKFDTGERFYLDKIVFNYHEIAPEVLQSDSVFTIFLLRDPLENLASILKVWHDCTEESIQTYYCRRMAQLQNYAALIDSKEKTFFLTYDQLLEDAQGVLECLQKTMDIRYPFSEQYHLIPTHRYGEFVRGDGSETLKAGQIVKQQTGQKKYDFDTKFFHDSVAAYHQCHATLTRFCSSYPMKVEKVRAF